MPGNTGAPASIEEAHSRTDRCLERLPQSTETAAIADQSADNTHDVQQTVQHAEQQSNSLEPNPSLKREPNRRRRGKRKRFLGSKEIASQGNGTRYCLASLCTTSSMQKEGSS